MTLTAQGRIGEIRVGGRVGAKVGEWTLKTVGGGAWTFEAPVSGWSAMLMEASAPKELRLTLDKRQWRFKNVTVVGGPGRVTISGQGKPEVY